MKLAGNNQNNEQTPADDLVRFWRLKVKVIAGRLGGEGICVDAGASKYILSLNFETLHIVRTVLKLTVASRGMESVRKLYMAT